MSDQSRGIERVAIIGVGAVGSTTAYAMVQAGSAKELFLVDHDRRRAEGELMDLQHCLPFSDHGSICVVNMDEVVHCDLIIIAAGVAQKPGESRIDLVARNTEVFQTMFPILATNNPHALFLIVTNPVDVMTRVALRLSGLPPERLFGSGTVLDTARFRQLISEHCKILPRHVHAYVVGEHGDSEVMVWSRATIGSFRVEEYCQLQGIPLTADIKQSIAHNVRSAAYQIIERKGATHFAIGLATVRLARALALHQDSLYTVSRMCTGAYGLKDTCLSVPTVVNRSGAHKQVELQLDAGEHTELLRSAEVLDSVYAGLKL